MKLDACIIFYHSATWNGLPSRQRYLMEAMSKHVPVIYIEEAEDRKWSVTYHARGENVTLVRGLAPALVRFERRKWNLVMWLWCRWHMSWVRRKYRRVIFWNCENWLRPNRFIPHDDLVFDCIDPSFENDPADVGPFQQRERELLGSADKVFATADALVEHCRMHHPDVTLINNACEPSEYSPEKIAASFKPTWWPATNKPIAAYLGTLDWRFDFKSTLAACRLNREVHFIIAGNALAELKSTVAEFATLANVTLTGRLSLDEGRYLLAHCDIGLIPFTAGKMNDAINPVKLYAYALLGKPVVGTAIRELLSRRQWVHVGQTPEEFAACVRDAIQAGGDEQVRQSLLSFALENTWDHRAHQAMEVLFPGRFRPRSLETSLAANA